METQLPRHDYKPESYEIPVYGKETLWKHNYPFMFINSKSYEFLFVEKRFCGNTITHLGLEIRKSYEIPICGKEILWKHNYPFMFINRKSYEIPVYKKETLWKHKYPVILINQNVMLFHFLERDNVKCQLPTYNGKTKMKVLCHDDVTT